MTLLPDQYFKIGNQETLAHELREFAKHDHHLIRLKVAEHPNSPHDVLAHLASDGHPDIRIAVGDHPSVSLELLGQLANDPNPDVRYALAENPNMPLHLLRMLAEDDNAYVSHRAQKTLLRKQQSEQAILEAKPNGSKKTG